MILIRLNDSIAINPQYIIDVDIPKYNDAKTQISFCVLLNPERKWYVNFYPTTLNQESFTETSIKKVEEIRKTFLKMCTITEAGIYDFRTQVK